MQYIMINLNLTFLWKKCIPTTKGAETEYTPVRRPDNVMRSNFEKLCKWLDGQTELFTLSELSTKMCSFAEKDLNVYSLKWMNKQLEQHYQNSIFFTDEPDHSNVVYFTDMESTILSKQWYKDRTESFNDEKWELLLPRKILLKMKWDACDTKLVFIRQKQILN